MSKEFVLRDYKKPVDKFYKFNPIEFKSYLLTKYSGKDKVFLSKHFDELEYKIASGWQDVKWFVDYPRLPSFCTYMSLPDGINKFDIILRGQKKLLLSEINFLSEIAPIEEYHVIYVGAGPGNHIKLLSELFPNVIFYLYDNKFDKRLYGCKNIHLNKKYFDEGEVQMFKKSLAGKRVAFISDIRNLDISNKLTLDEHNAVIIKDQALQRDWIEMLRPDYALLKFRLPYYDNATDYTYLDGDIQIQAYAPNSSTECRLKVAKPSANEKYASKVYNSKVHENKFFYLNNIIRKGIAFGNNNNFDQEYALEICKKYQILVWPETDVKYMYKMIVNNEW
jgi:hypothetical protein